MATKNKIQEAAKAVKEARHDNWQNTYTGLGTTRDKVQHTTFVGASRIADHALEALFHDDDMAARICQKPVEDMFRKGFELKIDGDAGLSSEVFKELKKIKAIKKIKEAILWSRVFGGAGVLIGANDGEEDLTQPLELKRVKDLRFLMSIDRRDLSVQSIDQEPLSPSFGERKTLLLNPAGIDQLPALVDQSRMLTFDGVTTTKRRWIANGFWGDSVLQRVTEPLRDFGVTWQAATHLLQEASIGVWGIQDLFETLASGEGRETLQARMEIDDMSKSVSRSIMIDAATESYTRQPFNGSGIDAILQQFVLRMAAAADMPVTILFGQSPTGLNATGEGDLTWWYDRIESMQMDIAEPAIRRIVEIQLAAMGKFDLDITIEFKPLWQLSLAEEQAAKKAQAEIDQIYLANGVVLPEEIGVSRFTPDGYSFETTIDVETRDEAQDPERVLESLGADDEPDPAPDMGTIPQVPPMPGQVPEQVPPPGQVPPVPDQENAPDQSQEDEEPGAGQ